MSFPSFKPSKAKGTRKADNVTEAGSTLSSFLLQFGKFLLLGNTWDTISEPFLNSVNQKLRIFLGKKNVQGLKPG
jgi:hypothetical protein